MDQVQAYRANDGKLFDTFEKCMEYEHALAWQTRVNEFLASNYNEYKGPAQSSMIKQAIFAWELFKVENQ